MGYHTALSCAGVTTPLPRFGSNTTIFACLFSMVDATRLRSLITEPPFAPGNVPIQMAYSLNSASMPRSSPSPDW